VAQGVCPEFKPQHCKKKKRKKNELGGEMAQTMYAHMNKLINKPKKEKKRKEK
jgi:hypothetical protein